MSDLKNLKKEKDALERMLLDKKGNSAADEAYQALRPYFKEIENMDVYYPIGRIRLAQLFLETNLSDDSELFSCYGRFANLVEGIEV